MSSNISQGPPSGSPRLDNLIREFYRTNAYKILKDSTKRTYYAAFDKFDKLLKKHVDEISRADIARTLSQLPAGAGYVFLSRSRRLFQYAKEMEYIEHLPTEGISFPRVGTHVTWKDWEIEKFINNSNGPVNLAAAMALYTGQRMSDVVRISWDDIKDGKIHIKQQKTGEELIIPIHPELKRMMDAGPDYGGGEILRKPHNGEAFSVDSMRQYFSRERDRLGLRKQLHFHGLRKAMAQRLAHAGATTAEIMAVGGWKDPRQVGTYTKGVQQELLAEQAMKKLIGNKDDD